MPATAIPTIASLRRLSRRLDRRRVSADRVLAAMREGQALHCSFERQQMWWLTSGMRVPNDVAMLVIIHAEIVPVGDALFWNAPSQTYRYVSKQEKQP